MEAHGMSVARQLNIVVCLLVELDKYGWAPS